MDNDQTALRDEFAARAMQAFIASQAPSAPWPSSQQANRIAMEAYRIAEAMLRARDAGS